MKKIWKLSRLKASNEAAKKISSEGRRPLRPAFQRYTSCLVDERLSLT